MAVAYCYELAAAHLPGSDLQCLLAARLLGGARAVYGAATSRTRDAQRLCYEVGECFGNPVRTPWGTQRRCQVRGC
jgi:hypothetical protein